MCLAQSLLWYLFNVDDGVNVMNEVRLLYLFYIYLFLGCLIVVIFGRNLIDLSLIKFLLDPARVLGLGRRADEGNFFDFMYV